METRPMELLHVDDSEDDLLLLQDMISDVPFARVTQTAQNGEMALALLRREGGYKDATLPDLILLDIRMPRKDGIETLKELKSDPALKSIPVVMLTTSDRAGDIHASYAGGACSYIIKPMNLNHFSESMKIFLDYWRNVTRVPRRTEGGAGCE